MNLVNFSNDAGYQIHGWMINRLKLKGSELLVYAVMYHFSEEGKKDYDQGQTLISRATGLPKSTMLKTVYSLEKKGCIHLIERGTGLRSNRYMIVTELI